MATLTYTNVTGVKGRAFEVVQATQGAVRDAAGLAQARAEQVLRTAAVKASGLVDGVNIVVHDGAFRTVVGSAATGGVAFGATAGAGGLACGAMVGAAVGIVPAFFTFGLSIPVGATVGGGAGCILSALGGAAVGAVGSGATGYGLYTHRHQIASIAHHFVAKAKDSVDYVTVMASNNFVAPVQARASAVARTVSDAKMAAIVHLMSARGAATSTYANMQKAGLRPWAVETAQTARVKVSQAAKGAQEVARDRTFQTIAVSGVSGAVVVGAGAGMAGLATGTVVGAALGLMPALFTFGLSIPLGAVLGGGTGLITGAATGTAVGAVGGGAMGYSVHLRRDDIVEAGSRTLAKAGDAAKYAKARAAASADYVKQHGAMVRARLAGASTGGTEGCQ